MSSACKVLTVSTTSHVLAVEIVSHDLARSGTSCVLAMLVSLHLLALHIEDGPSEALSGPRGLPLKIYARFVVLDPVVISRSHEHAWHHPDHCWSMSPSEVHWNYVLFASHIACI